MQVELRIPISVNCIRFCKPNGPKSEFLSLEHLDELDHYLDELATHEIYTYFHFRYSQPLNLKGNFVYTIFKTEIRIEPKLLSITWRG